MQTCIKLEYAFVIFWAHELNYDNIQLIDPRQEKHDVGIHKSPNGDLIIQKGVLKMAEYFNVKENKIIHMSYVDTNTFLFRFFSSEGIEINYAPQVVSVSNHDTHLGDYDPADFYYSMAKCLSENDTKSSSLVYDFWP